MGAMFSLPHMLDFFTHKLAGRCRGLNKKPARRIHGSSAQELRHGRVIAIQ
jgi:hypothetical protein